MYVRTGVSLIILSFAFQVGKDGHASLVREALATAGVRLDHMHAVKGPTGHAVVMLQPGGKNSIVLVQGANMSWPRLEDGIGRLTTTVQQLIRRSGAVLLQREVPDSVNLEAAKVPIATTSAKLVSSFCFIPIGYL
jgi:sugar/nucleoside kinase (ribokinase family)